MDAGPSVGARMSNRSMNMGVNLTGVAAVAPGPTVSPTSRVQIVEARLRPGIERVDPGVELALLGLLRRLRGRGLVDQRVPGVDPVVAERVEHLTVQVHHLDEGGVVLL